MTLKLNVLITISAKGKTFSVWSDALKELPWINLHEGHGSNLSEAIDDFYMSLPDKIIIDDDINFTLQLQNDSDYRSLLNAPRGLLPAKFFGRGLIQSDKDVFEFQTAYIYTI